VVTRAGGIPLAWHAYPGDRPDVTQFATMIGQLRGQYEAITAAAGAAAGADITLVFDAGQNSEDNFAHLAGAGLHYIGSVPASACPDLTALPASARAVVGQERFGALTASDTRGEVYGAERRAILTHLPELHQSQARGFTGTTLAKAGRKLDELAATLARGKARRPREKVEAEVETITRKPWVRRVITWQLSGDKPSDLRLAWDIDADAGAVLEEELFGKHILITDHDDWPVAEVVAGYRSQSEAEFSFRQLKDPHVVSFSPMHHWTEHNIRVHTFTCVSPCRSPTSCAARPSTPACTSGVRNLLGQLAAIGETVLIYPSTGGRPIGPPQDHRTHRRPAAAIRHLRTGPVRPPQLGHTPVQATTGSLTSKNGQPTSRSLETPARAPGRGVLPGEPGRTLSGRNRGRERRCRTGSPCEQRRRRHPATAGPLPIRQLVAFCLVPGHSLTHVRDALARVIVVLGTRR
jgi:hypothetical protein